MIPRAPTYEPIGSIPRELVEAYEHRRRFLDDEAMEAGLMEIDDEDSDQSDGGLFQRGYDSTDSEVEYLPPDYDEHRGANYSSPQSTHDEFRNFGVRIKTNGI